MLDVGSGPGANTGWLAEHAKPYAVDVEPVAFAPVLLDDGEGRTSRFPRALCRFVDPATGRRGVGWTEWNQPQGT